MSLGIVLIIKSALGTSPISSVPYVLSLALPFTIFRAKRLIFNNNINRYFNYANTKIL